MDWKDQLNAVIEKVGEEDTAKRIGVSVRSFSNYKTGKSKPFPNTQRLIKETYDQLYGKVSRETEPKGNNKTLDSLAESTAKLSESNLINARNIDRLITLLEGKSNFQKADMEEIHSAKIYALEEYVLRMGQELRHSSRKTESVALGKLEGEGFRLGEGTYKPANESEDKKGSQHKTEKVHGSSDGS